MRKVVVYGAGSMARTIMAELGEEVAGVVADNSGGRLGRHIVRAAVDIGNFFPPMHYEVVLAIGYQHGLMNGRRAELFEKLTRWRYAFRNNGTVSLSGSVWHAGSKAGVNVFVGSNVTVGHDAVVGDHAWVNSGVSIDGGAVIGERCVIGANAVIGAGVTLGARTLVGPGCVVLRDTEPNSVYIAAAPVRQRFSSDVFGSVMKI